MGRRGGAVARHLKARAGPAWTHSVPRVGHHDVQKRSLKDLEVEVENLGGRISASTGREQTAYYAQVLGKDVGKAVSILSDVLLNASLDEKVIEKERATVLRALEEVRSFGARGERAERGGSSSSTDSTRSAAARLERLRHDKGWAPQDPGGRRSSAAPSSQQRHQDRRSWSWVAGPPLRVQAPGDACCSALTLVPPIPGAAAAAGQQAVIGAGV